MKPAYRSSKRIPSDPLERAEENALALRDMEQADARELQDYDDHEESTARHDVPATPSIHVHMHSENDGKSEPPVKKQIRTGLVAIGSGIGLALVTVVAALLQRCGK